MKSSTDLYRLIVAMLSLPDMVLRSMGRKVVEVREMETQLMNIDK